MGSKAAVLRDLTNDQLHAVNTKAATSTEWAYFDADDEEWRSYNTARDVYQNDKNLGPDDRQMQDTASAPVGYLTRGSQKPLSASALSLARAVVAQLHGDGVVQRVRFIALPILEQSKRLAGENALTIQGEFLPICEIHDLRLIQFFDGFYDRGSGSRNRDWDTDLNTLRRRVARTLMLEHCEGSQATIKRELGSWGKCEFE